MKYLAFALALGVAGCSFSLRGDDAGSGGGGSDGGDVDLATTDDLASGGAGGGGGGGVGGGGGTSADLAMPPDLTPPPDLAPPNVCTAGSSSCSGNTLLTCPDGSVQNMTTCQLGCSMAGGAHCEQMYPRAPITRNDFDTTGLTATTLSANSVYIGADTGLIGPGNAPIRHANNVATTYEVHDGIGFHLVSIAGSSVKLGIYTFSSLTVNANVVMNAYGANGIALVSAGDMTMNGQFDATCAGNVNLAALFGAPNPSLHGPGGGDGGKPGTPSVGFGTGGVGGVNGDNTHAVGGGGGSYADSGGTGGGDGTNAGGAAGPTYGDTMLTTLYGGSGGGAGGQNGSTNIAYGGGGGGLAILVAQGTLTLGAGNMSGGINAGGCGGTANMSVGGGGGGSGGTILVQALTVHLAAKGVLAANGGGGAAGNAAPGMMTNGKPGPFGPGAAMGGQTGGSGDGGSGGNATTTTGGAGGTANSGGGGGGGAIGRIRLETQTGSATLDTGYAISPSATVSTVDIH